MRILYVGKDPILLRTRCEVLENAGYHCEYLSPNEVEAALQSKRFDLCILSAFVSEEEKRLVVALVGNSMPLMKLETLVLAPELLRMVQGLSNNH